MSETILLAGHRTEVYRSLPSTNDRAKELLLEGNREISAVLAGEQTAGRGRYERRFLSPNGGLYLTVITRRQIPSTYLPLLPLAAAAFASEALVKLGIEQTGIKWVNDLYLHDKKIAGILTEGVFTPEYAGAVVGIGLNICSCPCPGASSVEEETGLRLRVDTVSEAIAAALHAGLAAFPENLPDVLRTVRDRSVLDGREVVVSSQGGNYTARVRGITERGELLVERSDGKETALAAGEVSLLLK